MSDLSSIFQSGASNPPAPNAGANPQPEPTSAQTPLASIFTAPSSKTPIGDAVNAPISKQSPSSNLSDIFNPTQGPKSPVAPTKPYFAAVTPEGASLGFSDDLDASGKPFFAYRKPGDTSTTTDRTRVDTTFDPRVAAPQKQSDIATPRVVSTSEKADIKLEENAPKSDVIDHAMALTLAGSNDRSNLRAEPNDLNSGQGTFETDLDRQVYTGKISLFDAQKLEAANKKLPVPYTGPQPQSFWDKVKGFIGNIGQKVSDIVSPQKAEAATQNHGASGSWDDTSSTKPIFINGVEMGKGQITNPDSLDVYDSKGNYLKTFTGRTAGKDSSDYMDQLNAKNATPLEKERTSLENDSKTLDTSNQLALDAFNKRVDDYNQKLKNSNEEPSPQVSVQPSNPYGQFGRMVSSLYDTGASVLNDATNKLGNFIETYGDSKATIGDKVEKLGEATIGGFNVAILPLTEALQIPISYAKTSGEKSNSADPIRALGSGMENLFDAVSKGSHYEIKTHLDAIPSTILSDETKKKWEPLLTDIATLINSFALGGVTDGLVKTKLTESVQKLGNIIDAQISEMKNTPNKQGGFIGTKEETAATPLSPSTQIEEKPLEIATPEGEGRGQKKELTPEAKAIVGDGQDLPSIEKNVGDYVDKNKESLTDQYTQKYGDVYNVDNMKELIPGHAENRTLSESFHKPAAELLGSMVEKELSKSPVGDKNKIVFLGGATGAGKSTTIDSLREGKDRFNDAKMIVDGTLADVNRSSDSVRKALQTGHEVNIFYIDTSPAKLFDNLVSRAQSGGRTVPIETAYNTLDLSRKNIQRLNGKFGDNPKFNIKVIDSSGDVPSYVGNGVDFLRNKAYSNDAISQFKRDAYTKLDKLYEKGKITKKVYDGFTRRKKTFLGEPGGVRSSLWKGIGEESQTKYSEGNSPSLSSNVSQSLGEDKPVVAFKKGEDLAPNTEVSQAHKLIEKLFNKDEVSFLFPTKIDEGKILGKMTIDKGLKNPMIQVVQTDGKFNDKVLYHESFHAFTKQFLSTEERNSMISSIANNPVIKIKLNNTYKKLYGDDIKVQAEEYAADAFADWMKGKDAPKGTDSIFKRIYEKIKTWIKGLSKLNSVFEKAANKERTAPENKPPASESFKRNETPDEESQFVANQENSEALADLEKKGQELQFKREALANNPARFLTRYTNKMTGELPEVTAKGKSIFDSKGDDIVADLGFEDSESARTAYTKYATQKESLEKEFKKFNEDRRLLADKFKEDMESHGRGHPVGDWNPDILEANGGVTPPVVRGGIRAPEMDFTKFKDVAMIRLSRDTMERNIEKVAGPYSDELKDFVIEPVRKNEVDRIHFTNDLRTDIGKKLKSLGINVRSKEADLVQRFGEGMMNIDDLRKATKKSAEVQSAADYLRKVYDRLIDDWNEKRTAFGYKPISKRADYFRHFNDINEWTNSFGFLRSESQLPTAIAGQTAFFKPGKPFSTAELHRTGNLTSYDAIRGMDNYLESVSKQMFHIDSIQRGRALSTYIRQAANETNKIILPNFVQNVDEYTNLVSGKAAMLDRSIESTVGRPIMKFLNKASNLLARNIVVGNVSVAMTHLVSIPLNVATVDKAPFIQGMFKTLVSPLLHEPLTHIDGVESSFLTRRYPEKYIQATNFQKAEETLSWLFHITDVFKSKLAVASKYYERKAKGMSPEKAMHEADNYAGRIVGDYSAGNRPNLLSAQILKLFAQFQLGVNDGMSVLMHDIPHWEKGNKSKIAYRIVAFMVFSYLFNQVYKKIRGSGKGIDPIDAGMTLTGLNDEGAGQDFFSRLKLAGTDLAGELPFTSIAAGSFPLAQAIGQPIQDLLAGDGKKAGKTLLADFASPLGGGSQAKKTIEGISAYNKGETSTANGQTKNLVEKTTSNFIKGAIFGPGVFNNANGKQTETNRLIQLLGDKTGSITKQAEDLYTQMKASKDPEKMFNDLAANNPAMAKKVSQIADEEKLGITQNDRLIKQLNVSLGQRAKYIYGKLNALPNDTERQKLWQEYVDKKIITPQVEKQLLSLLGKT